MAIIGAILGDIAGSQFEMEGVEGRDWQNCELYIYAREHNCSYDDALIFAKTGKKMGKLAE